MIDEKVVIDFKFSYAKDIVADLDKILSNDSHLEENDFKSIFKFYKNLKRNVEEYEKRVLNNMKKG